MTYPALELLTGFTFLFLYLLLPNVLMSYGVEFGSVIIHTIIFYFLLFSALIFTFFYDLKWMEIDDRILIPMIIIAAIMPFTPNYPIDPTNAALGFLIPTVFFMLQIIISKGKWIGGGDLRIGALMGLALGWKLATLALFLGYLFGAVVSLYLLTSKKSGFKSSIPFAPFLVVGFYVAFFWGHDIINWYLNYLYI